MEKEALAFTGTQWTLIIQKSLAKDNNKKGRALFFDKVEGNYNGKSNHSFMKLQNEPKILTSESYINKQ